jgi:hypothetical protein
MLKQEVPPSGLRQRLLARLSSKKSEPPRMEKPVPQRGAVQPPASTAPTHSWYLYASVVMGALIIVGLLFFLNDQLRTTADLEKKLSDLQTQVQQQQDILAILQAPKVETLQLMSTKAGVEMSGRIFWDPEKRRAVLQVINLPAQPADKQYQLWLMKEKKYFSAGQFDVNKGGSNVMAVLMLPVGEKLQIEGFAVTLEPRGGNTQPESQIQLSGTTK